MNGINHTIWIIGIQHDLLVKQPEGKSGVKAALTFETKTVVSDASGNAMSSVWNNSDTYNNNFTDSTFRRNLTSNGSGTATLPKPIYYLLEDETTGTKELYDIIKPVVKEVWVKYMGASEWTQTTYHDPLFALSRREMTGDGSVEGKKYELYSKLPAMWKKKKDINGNDATYWLASADTRDYSNSWFINTDGNVGMKDVRQTAGISFGFCL